MWETIVHTVQQDPEAFIIFVLFILSEILGSMDRFKSSSVFQLLKTVLAGMFARTRYGGGVVPPVDPPANPPQLPPTSDKKD